MEVTAGRESRRFRFIGTLGSLSAGPTIAATRCGSEADRDDPAGDRGFERDLR